MCGIAGIVDLNAARDIDQDALKRMCAALAHRGPDGEGTYVQPGLGFGHRRLSIIDLENGAQPFITRDDACALTFNGEIYNYQNLAHELRGRGAQLRTQSDTEVLAEGLAAAGRAFVSQLRGMFAFAFFDPKANTLLLARDRLGEKPLYYHLSADGFFYFASEIGAICAALGHAPPLDTRAVADYFYYGYVPDPKSIYEGIHKLEAGHFLAIDLNAKPLNSVRAPQEYWTPRFAPDPSLGTDEAPGILAGKLDDAVNAQSVADVPLGAFLSGGVDSSAIVAALATQRARAPITCTIGFSEQSFDERPFAREISDKFNTQHHEELVTLNAAELLPTIAASYGEPFADSSALPSFLVAKAARKHVTVALSGDGGDELFAGYRRYPFFVTEERLRALCPHSIRTPIFDTLGRFYPKLDWAPRPLRFKSTFLSLAKSSAAGYFDSVAINSPLRIEPLLSPDFISSLGDYHPASVIEHHMANADSDDPLTCALYTDLKTWLPGRMLTKVDRASMANSLEVRPPLLDHEFVEWSLKLPTQLRLRNGIGKFALKESQVPRLGRSFIERKKQGFGLPVDQWLRAGSANPLDDLLVNTKWRESGILNASALNKMINEHKSGAANYGQELWSCLMFSAFVETSAR